MKQIKIYEKHYCHVFNKSFKQLGKDSFSELSVNLGVYQIAICILRSNHRAALVYTRQHLWIIALQHQNNSVDHLLSVFSVPFHCFCRLSFLFPIGLLSSAPDIEYCLQRQCNELRCGLSIIHQTNITRRI